MLVGLCQFRGRPDARGSVEIAYSVLSDFRNRGYATEAVARLVRWAFGHPNVNEVVAETMPYRRHSIRIMEKNGFQPAGPGSAFNPLTRPWPTSASPSWPTRAC